MGLQRLMVNDAVLAPYEWNGTPYRDTLLIARVIAIAPDGCAVIEKNGADGLRVEPDPGTWHVVGHFEKRWWQSKYRFIPSEEEEDDG